MAALFGGARFLKSDNASPILINHPYKDYGGKRPLGFVVLLSLDRRHLNQFQRGRVFNQIATMVQGERTDLEPSENFRKVSQSKAAEVLDISDRTGHDGRKIVNSGIPELVEAVDKGEVASRIANMELGDNQHGSANLQTQKVSVAQASEMMNVSERSGHDGRKVVSDSLTG